MSEKKALTWKEIDEYTPSEAPTGMAVLDAIEAARSDREELDRLNKEARAVRDKVKRHRNAVDEAIRLDRGVVAWAGRDDQSAQQAHQAWA